MVKAEHRLPLMGFLVVALAAVVILGIGLATPAVQIVVKRPAAAAPIASGQAPDMVLSHTFEQITPLRTASRPEKRTVSLPTSQPQAAAPALAPVTVQVRTTSATGATTGSTIAAGTSTAPRHAAAPTRHRASTKPVVPATPSTSTNARTAPQAAAPQAAPDRPRGPGSSHGHGTAGQAGKVGKVAKTITPLAAPTQLAATPHVAPGRAKKAAAPLRGPAKGHGQTHDQTRGGGGGKVRGPGAHGRTLHRGR
jgi:cytoskeletal protein RodZ